MLSINDLEPGIAISVNGQPHVVVSREHAMMGRGGGFVRTKLKNLTNGAVVDTTFKGNDKIEEASLERYEAQFLYFEGDSAHFMNTQTFEQFALTKDQIGPPHRFMVEGVTVEVVSYQKRPMTVSVPIKLDLKISYTEPGFKGNTASATLKPAALETGAAIQVPLFITTGDTIRVNTQTGEYLERVSKAA